MKIQCQKCKSKNCAEIIYGLPAFDSEMEKRLEEKKIILGGCCVMLDENGKEMNPRYHCNECHFEF